MNVFFAFALIVFGSFALNANGQDGSQLLMGTLVRQGPSKHDVLYGQSMDYEFPEDYEEVKGTEVGKSADETIDPPNELMMGQSLGEFEKRPEMNDVLEAIQKERPHNAHGPFRPHIPYVENKKGTVLDSDVKSGRYVSNPLKVIGEIKAAHKEMPEILEGEILAGDAAELDVLSLNPPMYHLGG